MGTNKTLYGILAFGPIGLILIGILGMIAAAISEAGRYRHDPPPIFWLFAAFLVLASILSLVSLIMYLIHISRNTKLDDGTRIGWIVGMVFAHGIVAIVYFFLHIANERREPSPEYVPPSNPWDK